MGMRDDVARLVAGQKVAEDSEARRYQAAVAASRPVIGEFIAECRAHGVPTMPVFRFEWGGQSSGMYRKLTGFLGDGWEIRVEGDRGYRNGGVLLSNGLYAYPCDYYSVPQRRRPRREMERMMSGSSSVLGSTVFVTSSDPAETVVSSEELTRRLAQYLT